jgi:hypothetical protein
VFYLKTCPNIMYSHSKCSCVTNTHTIVIGFSEFCCQKSNVYVVQVLSRSVKYFLKYLEMKWRVKKFTLIFSYKTINYQENRSSLWNILIRTRCKLHKMFKKSSVCSENSKIMWIIMKIEPPAHFKLIKFGK